MSGPKTGAQRAKTAKNLRTTKSFRNDDPEKLAAYKKKMASRAERKLKRNRRKGK